MNNFELTVPDLYFSASMFDIMLNFDGDANADVTCE